MNADSPKRKEPEYLMALGSVYLEENLLDAAGDAWSLIPPSHSLYLKAAKGLLEVHALKGELEEVVRLGKELLARDDDDSWLANHLGVAYQLMGDPSSARQYLWQSLSYLPENDEIRAALASLNPGSDQPRIKRLIKENLDVGITPHVALDCIAPLIWNARPATDCLEHHQRLLPGSPPPEKIKRAFIDLAGQLFSRFGIYTAFVRYAALNNKGEKGARGKAYFSKDPTLFERASEIERAMWEDIERNSPGGNLEWAYMRLEGELLGYPSCCVEWAHQARRDGQSVENLALIDLIAEELACTFDVAKPLPPELAYFALDFYPNHPRCRNAEQVGKDILWRYAREDAALAQLYRPDVLSLNRQNVRKRPSSYREFIASFNAHICGELDIPIPRGRPQAGFFEVS